MSGPIPVPGSRGSGQFGSNRVTPADGDTVALSQTVITIVSLPATPGAAVTLTAGSPATSPEFWAILRRDALGFDTYALTFPGEYHDPEGLLAAGGSASAVVLHLVPDQYSDGTPVWATKIESLEGGAVTFDDLESYAANTLATAEGYTDTAIGALGTAATKNVGTGSGDVAAGDAPAAALTAAEGYTDTAVAAAIAGRVDKAPVRLVATTNLSLTGSATIDGVAVVTGNRVLAAGQTAGAANGIYVANTAGSWTRSPDADTSAEMVNGLAVSIQEGTDHANQLWVLTTEGTIVLGTTVLVFSALSEQVQSVFGRKGAVAAQSGDYSVAQVTGAAPLASPTFTGTPAAPTASAGTNTTQLATTAFVAAESGLLIPKSLGTAKGDLVGFSASGTPVRVPVGTNGYRLIADSTQTSGLNWQAPATAPETWMHTLFPLAPSATTGDWSVALATGSYFNLRVVGNQVQNDVIGWDVWMSAGTWDSLLTTTTTNLSGIATVAVDGSSVGTIDAYSASSTANVTGTVTGFTVATSGKKRVSLTMSTKNGSSGGYKLLMNALTLRRTA